jgi:hypothetical protein
MIRTAYNRIEPSSERNVFDPTEGNRIAHDLLGGKEIPYQLEE